MKRKHFYRIMSMILIYTMLIGQLMVGEALAGFKLSDDESPLLLQEDSNPDNSTPDTDNPGTTDDVILIIPDDDGSGDENIQTPAETDPPELDLDDDVVGGEDDQKPESPEDVVLLLDEVVDGKGGIGIKVESSQKKLHDGDSYTFTVTVSDSDLNVDPNLNPGDTLTIKMPEFLTTKDMDEVLQNCFQYFERDYIYDEENNTITLTFKNTGEGGTWANVQFSITMTVSTIGYDGNGQGQIEVGLGETVKGDIDLSVDVGTGSGEAQKEPYVEKRIWSNYKNSEYGVDGSYVMRDPDSPIGYVVAFGVNRNYESSVVLNDNMSNGNLSLCDVNGNTAASMSSCFTLYVGGVQLTPTAEDGSSLSYTSAQLGTIVISRSGTGFSVVCSTDTQLGDEENQIVDVAVKYYACVTGDSNNITNTVSLTIDNADKGSSSQNIRRYDSQGLVVTKSIHSIGGDSEKVDITEDTTITFRFILTQYGTGSLYKNGDIISIDNLEPCFTYVSNTAGEDLPFRLEQDTEDRQVLNIVKNGDGSIPTGQYTIDFTVTIDLDKLGYGEQATNTVGNTVYIRRMAKLDIDKRWLSDDQGNPVNKGEGATFTLYNAAGGAIANSGEMSAGDRFTLYIKADNLAGGTNTYTLRENVDEYSGYTAAKDMAVVINKDTETGIVTIVSIDGIRYNEGMATVDVENKPDSGVGSLTFKKYAGSADEANLLDGGKYELHKVEVNADGTEADTLVETFSTVNGVWVKNDLPYGVYYVKEIFAPPGYVLEGSSTGRVELKKTAPHQGLSLVNQLYQNGEIEILKKDEKGQPLAGVTFTIKSVPGPGINESKTTDGNGAVSFTGLVSGTYSITETLPEGYSGFAGDLYVTIDENGQAQTINAENGVTVSGNKITINWKNTQLFGKLTITKLGGSNASPLMGASFALYDSNGEEVRSGSTDENGILSFTGLPYGNYKLKETAAPEGYVISPDLDAGIDVKISSTQSELSLTFTNQTQKGSIKVIKTDAVSGAVLKGAQFGLYSDENAENLLRSGFTDSDGVCLFTDLEKGIYYIKEISAPTGYQLNSDIIKVEVGVQDEGSETEAVVWDHDVPVENSKRLYKLTVKKTDENGTRPLSGAEFQLSGGGIEQTAVSGPDGIAVFTDLPFGEYTITETKAPDGYALAKPITVIIDGSNTPAVYSVGQSVDGGTIKDTHTTLTVYKVDDKDESKGLEGTGFKIRSDKGYVQATGSDGSYSFTGFTDSADQGTVFMTGPNGTFILEYLPLGSYTLVEVQAPDGYVISEAETGFAIEYAFQSVTVGNTQIRGKLHLVKTDAFGKLLPGVGFTLKNAEGYVQADGQNGSYTYTGIGETPMVLYTGDDGSLTVDGLLWGVYTLDEAADTTPDGLLPKTGIQFTVTAEEHGKTVEIKVKNERELGRFEFVKLDAQSEALPGAVFKLEPVSGNEYSLKDAVYAVSDENGKVSFENIPYGVYKLSEYLAPYGKELSNQVFYISIGGATCEGVKISTPPTQWVNDDIEIKVTVRKVSTDGRALAGAVFRILDEDGNVLIPTLTVNSTEGEEFELPVGVYYIEEVSAPANYVMESTPVRFQVTASGPNEVVLKNAPFTGSLTIRKTDAADGSALAGAEFKVYGKEDYAINGSQAKALFTVTTNSDGTAHIDGIPAGEYAVVEVRAPAGYELSDPTVQYFRISNTEGDTFEQVELSFENQASRYLIFIEKTDIDTGVRLSGASFAVSGPDFYTVVTTGDDGTVTVQVPRMGEYTIVELRAPEGYSIDPNVYSVTVDAHTPEGAEVQTHFNSKDYPTRILFQKVDEEGQPLEGAVFAIYRVSGEGESLMSFSFSDGVYIYSPEGDVQEIPGGSAVIEQLPVGEYVLRETTSPDGYISLGDIAFTVDAGLYDKSLTLTVENIPHSQGVAVCKESSAGIRLAGAEFSLYDEAGNLLESKTTGASGYAVFTGLGVGKYSIKETKAPAGYQPIDEEFTFEVDGNGEIHVDGFVRAEDSYLPFYVLTVTNSPVEQSFRIRKLSAVSGDALAGAQFRILGGGMDAVFTTGEDGLTPPITLPVGEYMLTEIKAPNGYIAESESHHLLVSEEGVEIDGSPLADDAMLYTVENAPASFRLAIIKRDENSAKPLAGAGFTITGQDGSKYSLITDEDGRTEILSLQPGTYAISEVLAPEGYNVPLAGWSFTVDEGSMQISEMSGGAEHSFADGLLTITLSNKRTTGNLMIFKYDAGDESIPLPNAQFRVKDGEGNDVWFTVTNGVYRFADSGTAGAGNLLSTNAMGQALLEGLPFGDYTVYEWEAPEGYRVLTEGIQVKIREQDETTELRIPNERLLRKVTVLKQSDEENPINLIGAVFALYEVDGEGRMHFVSEATTLYDGKAEFIVPYGDYVIAEIKAPEGYELSDSSPVSFSYNADTPDDYEFSFVFRNEKSFYSLEVYKYDAEDKTIGLENAEFAVTDSRGFTKLIVTGSDGVARLDDLPYDDYTVREVSAPDGYYLNDQVFTVSREQLTHGVSLRIEVPDTFIVGSVLLRKVDHEDNSLILDAEFTVYDSDDRPLCWQETEDGYILSDEGDTVIHAGEVTLSGLPAGTYRISEVKAPDGYLVLDSDRSFTINAENALACIEIEIENTQRKVAVGIIKMDAEDHTKRLEGAEFTLYRYEDGTLGEALMTVVSDRNGLAVFTDLVAGQYRIIETKAPDGYKLLANPVDFRIDGDGRVFVGKNGAELSPQGGVFMAGLLNRACTKDLTVKKVSSIDGTALPGASFTISGDDASWRITIGKDGTAKVSLPYGEYIIQELIAPDGYVLDDTKHLITVSESGISIDGAALNELIYTIENSPLLIPIMLHKQDSSSGNALRGAEFTITGGGESFTLVTNASGNTDTIYLRPGTYSISETKAPGGYIRPIGGWTLTVSKDGAVSVSGGQAYVALDARSVTITLENTKQPDDSPGGPDIAKTGQISSSSTLLTGAALMLLSFSGLMALLISEYRRRRDASERL